MQKAMIDYSDGTTKWWQLASAHKVTWTGEMVMSIYTWCDVEIGVFNYIIESDNIGTRNFYFKREEDKVKFILRWL